MSQQTICDQCGEPIDTNGSWVSVTVQAREGIPGPGAVPGMPPMAGVMGAMHQLDFHTDHLPEELGQIDQEQAEAP